MKTVRVKTQVVPLNVRIRGVQIAVLVPNGLNADDVVFDVQRAIGRIIDERNANLLPSREQQEAPA